MGCIWPSLGAMPFSETHTKVVDSLPVTLISFTRASSPIHHSSATILLPHSPTSSPFSSFDSSSQFMPLSISLLTTFNNPPLLTYCFASSLNVSCSSPRYNSSNFPVSALFLSTNSFSFPFLLFKHFWFPSIFQVLSNLFPLWCPALSFIVILTLWCCICFPSCWLICPSCLAESWQQMPPGVTHRHRRRRSRNHHHAGSSHTFEHRFPRGGPR